MICVISILLILFANCVHTQNNGTTHGFEYLESYQVHYIHIWFNSLENHLLFSATVIIEKEK